jgi:hypothetical protein
MISDVFGQRPTGPREDITFLVVKTGITGAAHIKAVPTNSLGLLHELKMLAEFPAPRSDQVIGIVQALDENTDQALAQLSREEVQILHARIKNSYTLSDKKIHSQGVRIILGKMREKIILQFQGEIEKLAAEKSTPENREAREKAILSLFEEVAKLDPPDRDLILLLLRSLTSETQGSFLKYYAQKKERDLTILGAIKIACMHPQEYNIIYEDVVPLAKDLSPKINNAVATYTNLRNAYFHKGAPNNAGTYARCSEITMLWNNHFATREARLNIDFQKLYDDVVHANLSDAEASIFIDVLFKKDPDFKTTPLFSVLSTARNRAELLEKLKLYADVAALGQPTQNREDVLDRVCKLPTADRFLMLNLQLHSKLGPPDKELILLLLRSMQAETQRSSLENMCAHIKELDPAILDVLEIACMQPREYHITYEEIAPFAKDLSPKIESMVKAYTNFRNAYFHKGAPKNAETYARCSDIMMLWNNHFATREARLNIDFQKLYDDVVRAELSDAEAEIFIDVVFRDLKEPMPLSSALSTARNHSKEVGAASALLGTLKLYADVATLSESTQNREDIFYRACNLSPPDKFLILNLQLHSKPGLSFFRYLTENQQALRQDLVHIIKEACEEPHHYNITIADVQSLHGLDSATLLKLKEYSTFLSRYPEEEKFPLLMPGVQEECWKLAALWRSYFAAGITKTTRVNLEEFQHTMNESNLSQYAIEIFTERLRNLNALVNNETIEKILQYCDSRTTDKERG